MTFQILPNKFKPIGLSIFIICCGIPLIATFLMGLFQPFDSNENSFFIREILSVTVSKWLSILTILGMLIYMLSKEKVEDDYISKLRLESYQLTTIMSLGITFILLLINSEIEFNLSYLLYIYIATYLITFHLKKRL